MNCIAGLGHWVRNRSGLCLRRLSPVFSVFTTLPVTLLAIAACSAPASETAPAATTSASAEQIQIAQNVAAAEQNERIYEIDYRVTPDPLAAGVTVDLVLRQDGGLLRELDMHAPAAQFNDFSGDGEVTRDGDRLIWHPPPEGGTLSWFAKVNHQRNGESYDAYITDDWAIFRAEDIIPRAGSRVVRGAQSRSTLAFQLTNGWSAVTEYFGRDGTFRIDNPQRRFDRPAGWILLGNIGVRFENISGVRVNVAAPVGHGLRRMDIIALLGWSLPEIVRILPDFPDRLTIIGAADPMWRGGLSGPRSLYIHADRPLLSENATSTLLHEIMHIALGRGAESGADWIVEGLAEYYSLLVLRRSGTISESRHAASLRGLREWGRESENLCSQYSSGPVTARAVSLFADLDAEIQQRSRKKFNLDDVIRALAGSANEITINDLRTVSRNIIESDVESLSADKLPGCTI